MAVKFAEHNGQEDSTLDLHGYSLEAIAVGRDTNRQKGAMIFKRNDTTICIRFVVSKVDQTRHSKVTASSKPCFRHGSNGGGAFLWKDYTVRFIPSYTLAVPLNRGHRKGYVRPHGEGGVLERLKYDHVDFPKRHRVKHTPNRRASFDPLVTNENGSLSFLLLYSIQPMLLIEGLEGLEQNMIIVSQTVTNETGGGGANDGGGTFIRGWPILWDGSSILDS
ncbi:hypothetical protein EVAR_52426_1 [Eumeta japonica]|uniref:Uncharacterized protein n=1 Tax=Eumeta variegata TaxID=151549 RepID=A0A4C1YHP1_EUMVA|nr:hypothetical protein EVAR_52426_1 [Eumeta japonica]